MEPSDDSELDRVFDDLEKLSASERVAYLDKLAITKPHIAKEVREVLDVPVWLGPVQSAFMDALGSAFSGELSGEVEGKYVLQGRIGSGGMGQVYRAVQTAIEREVAIKFLDDEQAQDPRLRAQFLEEARAAASIDHPNIVSVTDFGEFEGRPFLVMNLVRGCSLKEIATGMLADEDDRLRGMSIAFGRGSFEHLSWVVEQSIVAAEAVAHLHSRSLIHRDIKPSNLMYSKDGRLILVDLGLTKRLRDGAVESSGLLFGTPLFASPEQVQAALAKFQKSPQPIEKSPSAILDHRTDIYSLGATMDFMLTSSAMFPQSLVLDELLANVISVEPRLPSAVLPGIPRDLETIVLKARAKEPAARYQTAQELADDLRRYSRGEPIRARRVSPIERIAKWVRRHKLFSFVAGLSVALLCAFLLLLSKYRISDASHSKQIGEKDRRLNVAEVRRVSNELAAKLTEAATQIQGRDFARAQQVLNSVPVEQRGWEWQYLVSRCGMTRIVQEAQLPAAISEDGNVVAYRVPFDQPEKGPWKLGVISGIESGAPLELSGHRSQVHSIAVSPDGKWIASGSGLMVVGQRCESEIIVWRVDTGDKVLDIDCDGNRVPAIAICPDNDTIVALEVLWHKNERGTNLKIISIRTGTIRNIQVATSSESSAWMSIAESGPTVFVGSGGFGGSVKSIDLQRGAVNWEQTLDQGIKIDAVQALDDGNSLFAMGEGFDRKKTTYRIVRDKNAPMTKREFPELADMQAPQFAANGKQILGVRGNVLRAIDVESGIATDIVVVGRPEFACNAAGSTLAVAHQDNHTRHGDLSISRIPESQLSIGRLMPTLKHYVDHVGLSPNGANVYAIGRVEPNNEHRQLTICDAETIQIKCEVAFEPHVLGMRTVPDVAFSENGEYFACRSPENSNALDLRRIVDGSIVAAADFGERVSEFGVDPTGTMFAASTVSRYSNRRIGNETVSIPTFRTRLRSINSSTDLAESSGVFQEFLKNGSVLLLMGEECVAREMSTMIESSRSRRNREDDGAIGRRVYSRGIRFVQQGYSIGWCDGKVTIRNVHTGEVFASIETDSRGVTAAAVNQSLSRLALGVDEGAIAIWEIPVGVQLLQMPVDGEMVDLTFRKDGTGIVAIVHARGMYSVVSWTIPK